jgi:hypothetical protein
MKLVVLMFLEDDAASVRRLLQSQKVATYSELSVRGHGQGTAGWYGDVAPFQSSLYMVFLPDDEALNLMAAVENLPVTRDKRRPIRAWQMDVESAVQSGSGGAAGSASASV